MKEVQISAFISEDTKAMLEREARMSGRKKGYLIEQALRHYLLALQELPADMITNPRIVVSARSGAEILERMENPAPTEALRKLMRGHGD